MWMHCAKLIDDGSLVKKCQVILEIEGKAKDILKGERTALNLLMRMSGIATETRLLIKIVRDAGSAEKLVAPGKPAPGCGFDKKAVIIGGGTMHRQRLDDMALIKSNHVYISGSVACCIQELKEKCGSEHQNRV